MRELLLRWAELEPARCQKTSKNVFTIKASLTDLRNIYNPDDLSGLDLAWMQWVVQSAIVKRGWSLELNYNPDYPDPNNPYDAAVNSLKSGGWGLGNDNFVAPLLEAYLYTLERER